MALRKQAKACQFTNIDEEIRDHIVEKFTSAKLRKRIFKKADMAKILEVTEEQVKNGKQSRRN